MDDIAFWEKCHKKTGKYLTGKSFDEVIKDLLLSKDLFVPGKRVLNIGVGDAKQYVGLAKTGCIICSLDISPSGLEKVAVYGEIYLPTELSNLPSNSIDIVLSRLVAQHMFDEDLLYQLEHVFRVLTSTGFLAIQFAGFRDDNKNDKITPEETVLAGGRCRSNNYMTYLIEKSGGTTFLSKEVPITVKDIFWRIIHARKL